MQMRVHELSKLLSHCHRGSAKVGFFRHRENVVDTAAFVPRIGIGNAQQAEDRVVKEG